MKKFTFCSLILAGSCLALAPLSGLASPKPAVVPLFDAPTGMFLGAVSGKTWLKAEKAAPLLPKTGISVAHYDAKKRLNFGFARPLQSMGAPCPETLQTEFAPKTPGAAKFSLGRSATNIFPRRVRVENPQSAVYRGIVTKILRANGLGSPAQIQQIWRVDLEGDGVDEVLISAARKVDYGDPERISAQVRAGDYAILMMRKIVNGQAKNILLEASFHKKNIEFSAPSFNWLVAVFDANGDGRMEVLTSGAYYEGGWTELHELQNNTLKSVLGAGCGA